MADNNNVNRDNQTNVAEDDPFAELARIMNQGAQGSVSEPADEAEPEADPFAVDLEQELLGDLDEVDAAYPAEPAATEPQFEPAEEFDPDTTDATDAVGEAGDYLAEAEPEPESWQSGNQGQFSDAQPADDYWANAEPLTDQPIGPEAGEAGWQAGAAHADTEASILADVDMDFGDLDAPATEEPADADEQFAPVEAESVPQFAEAPQAQAADGDGVSIEQELEMLLADGSQTPDLRDERDGQPAQQEDFAATAEDGYGAEDPLPAQATQPGGSTIFTRANFPGSGPGNGGDETHDYAARDDEPAPAADDYADAATDGAEPEADPFASLSAIASEAAEPEPSAAAAEYPADFETVDVPETALAQEDDLDLPDLPGDEPAGDSLADDLDADFAYDFPAAEEPARTVSAAQDEPPLEDEDRFYAEALGFSAAAGAARAFDRRDEAAGGEPFDADMERELDDALEDPAAYAMPAEEQPARRNGFLIAGVVIGVALVGGIGAFALSFGGGDADTPVLVSADDQPIKVKPEDPGGATQVPNQDSVAYEAATGGDGDQAPQQESLVTTTEEPVNIASRTAETDRLPGVDEGDRDLDAGGSGKVEDRLPATANGTASEMSDEIAAVQPRRVRTMIVRPDGTLVPREEAEPQNTAPAATESAAAEQPAADAEPLTQTPVAESAPAVEEEPAMAAEGAPAEETVAAAEAPDAAPLEEIVETPAAAAPEEQQTAATQVDEPVTPSEGPVAPSRPAVQDTGQTERVTQAAAATTRTQPATPEPAPTTASEWSMQIASQPTAESAQTTYQELARRYGNLLDGRGVNIVRAEIPGKGTYFRVRIPTTSRDDGITLCERYKAAGGSCFVSK